MKIWGAASSLCRVTAQFPFTNRTKHLNGSDRAQFRKSQERCSASALYRSKFIIAELGLLMWIFAAGLCSSSAAQTSKMTTFDAPGSDITPNDYNGTFPSAINNKGEITGFYVDTNLVCRGFLRSPSGSLISFEAPGADTTAGSYNGTLPTSINDRGEIAGYYYDANGFMHGFLRDRRGAFTSFNVTGVGGFGTKPLVIDLEGAIVGFYTDPNYSFHAFLRNPNGRFTTWIGPDACTGSGAEGCFGSGASNINLLQTIAGGFEDNGFVHHNFVRSALGTLKVFDIPGAGTGAYQGTGCPGCSLGLNAFGAVAGIYSDGNYVNHGFLRSLDGKVTTFDAPGAGTDAGQGTGCFSDCAVSLNNWGAITGVYTDSNYQQHGYLRSPDGHIKTIDPPGSGGTSPLSINDWGLITGYYLDSNNVFHGFLSTP
jgi:hypothetical protein